MGGPHNVTCYEAIPTDPTTFPDGNVIGQGGGVVLTELDNMTYEADLETGNVSVVFQGDDRPRVFSAVDLNGLAAEYDLIVSGSVIKYGIPAKVIKGAKNLRYKRVAISVSCLSKCSKKKRVLKEKSVIIDPYKFRTVTLID